MWLAQQPTVATPVAAPICPCVKACPQDDDLLDEAAGNGVLDHTVKPLRACIHKVHGACGAVQGSWWVASSSRMHQSTSRVAGRWFRTRHPVTRVLHPATHESPRPGDVAQPPAADRHECVTKKRCQMVPIGVGFAKLSVCSANQQHVVPRGRSLGDPTQQQLMPWRPLARVGQLGGCRRCRLLWRADGRHVALSPSLYRWSLAAS